MTQTRTTILVPVDFSPNSDRALALARELAARLGAEVILLHVFEPPAVYYPEVTPMMLQNLYQDALPASRRALERLVAASGGLQALFREGDAGHEIVRAAEELAPLMIVMGTHGRRGLRRLLLGSVAEYVVRHADAPVLTVRGDAAEG